MGMSLTREALDNTAAALATKVASPAISTRHDPRTRVLLEAPIAATLLRLAAPNMLVMLAQAAVGLIETYFVGRLGTDALAGVALVFPLVMLMQMMSAGAMGGGISSAVARALGAGKGADADALALHALVIALIFGLVFMLAMLGGGRTIYMMMGGGGATLTAALAYSNVVFSAAVLIWVFNSLGNVVRGTGNMMVPAIITLVGVIALVPLSPCLILGLGPFPRLGVAGGAVAVIAYYAAGSIALAAYPLVGSNRRSPGVARPRPALAAVLRHFTGRSGCNADHGPDESHDCHNHGYCRWTGLRRDRRVRRRLAARIFAGAADLRLGQPARRDGRHLHRCRSARASPTHGVDRRR